MFRSAHLDHHPTHGFRFSLRDGIAIITAVVLAWLCWRPLGQFALIFPITLGHFLLFCNTFRVHRYFELTWAGIFVVNVAAWVLAGQFAWAHVLWVQTPVTMTGIVMAILSPGYHGIFSRAGTRNGEVHGDATRARRDEHQHAAVADVACPVTNLPWWRHDRPWGFRFSALDSGVMLAGVVVIALSYRLLPDLSVLTAFTLGHFLLFCNTFRIGGERATLWTVVLIGNAAGWACSDHFTWTWLIATQLVVTCALITNCVWSRSYHGIACEHINPLGYRVGALGEGAFTRRALKWIGMPSGAIDLLTGRKSA